MADPEISDPLADPDGDGLNDLGEYAYNLNPLVADRNTAPAGDRGMPRAALDQDHLEITFVRRKPPVDLIYDIAHGTDLQSWADALAPPPHLTLDSAVDVGPPGTLERVTLPHHTADRRRKRKPLFTLARAADAVIGNDSGA